MSEEARVALLELERILQDPTLPAIPNAFSTAIPLTANGTSMGTLAGLAKSISSNTYQNGINENDHHSRFQDAS
jgi:hypothetical protein